MVNGRFVVYVIYSRFFGGVKVSTEKAEDELHAEDDRWPPKSSVKKVTANTDYAFAA